MKKTYKIRVTRTYYVTDVIEVEIEGGKNFISDTMRAKGKAEEISGNKDYTGQLELDIVESQIL